MAYIGNPPVVQATRTVNEFTATSGQTTFTPAGGYTVGFIDVEVNGVTLGSGDYTATDGSTVVLGTGATSGDLVRIIAYGTFTTATAVSKSGDTMSGPLVLSGNASSNLQAMPLQQVYNYVGSEGSVNFRNRIINGDMRIDQRNAGAAVTTNGAYPVDRFVIGNSTDGAYSAQQDSSAPAGFVNSLKVTTTTADGTLTTTQVLQVQYRIEGTNVADLAWGTANAKTVTLSFWVRSSLTGTFGGSLKNQPQDRSYPFTYSISVADTWEQKTITILGDTTGTWLTTTGIGLRVNFGLGAGPDVSGTANAWAGANYGSATGATSVVGTLNATWYITGVQLEVGSVATPFERRSYGTELSLCQRYFAKTYDYDVAPGTVTLAGAMFTIVTSANISQTTWCLPVEMRDNPTVTVYNGDTGGTGTWRDGGATARTVTAVGIGTRNVSFQATAAAANSTLRGHGIASAEL